MVLGLGVWGSGFRRRYSNSEALKCIEKQASKDWALVEELKLP